MDAVKFVKTINRMCKYYDMCSIQGCPLKEKELPCDEIHTMNDKIEELTQVVEEWNKEHPAKTRQSKFLKLFPFYPELGFNTKGILTLAPCSVDKRYREHQNEFTCNYECCKCCEKYWLEDIE